MKRNLIMLAAAVFAAASALASQPTIGAAGSPEPKDYYGRIAVRLAANLSSKHVLRHRLDDEISRSAWTNLFNYLDSDHSIFLASDLNAFAPRSTMLDDELAAGDVSFGYDVFRVYRVRLAERIGFITNFLAGVEWDFSKCEEFAFKRKEAPWPESREAAEAHWRRRLKNEALAIRVARELDSEDAAAKSADSSAQPEPAAEKSDAERLADEEKAKTDAMNPEQLLIRKYRRYAMVLGEPDEEEVLQYYLSAVCRAYDPHTDYLSPVTKEDFDMDMNLTLCGVGAVLGQDMDDGSLKISEVMPGGPMAVDGRIRAGDRIVGVRQGDGEMEDILWQPLRKTIHKIRGKKGTRVTLEIVPRGDATGTTRKLIELVRDEIKLDEQRATGRVERVAAPGGGTLKLGYVYLPGFYGTEERDEHGEKLASCSRDVRDRIAEFNSEGVEGMVLDLRGDGGGSLPEAIELSALFVPGGPVVVVGDGRRAMPLQIQRGNRVVFRKPLVVLVDRASASASEIVAGHLRDVGRAVVVGDTRTHGKGTVQTVMPLGKEKFGSAKITTMRFYRINGDSTQARGVASDIVLPSLLDSLADIGEEHLPHALPFSSIRSCAQAPFWNLPDHLPKLRELSAARQAEDERIARHLKHVEELRKLQGRDTVPLEYAARKAQMRRDRELNSDEGDGEDDEAKPARKTQAAPRDDAVLEEAMRILADLVRLNNGAEMPSAPVDWYNAILGF